jgi:hypothetical protein
MWVCGFGLCEVPARSRPRADGLPRRLGGALSLCLCHVPRTYTFLPTRTAGPNKCVRDLTNVTGAISHRKPNGLLTGSSRAPEGLNSRVFTERADG